jgi:RHS repeat-associated protein
MSYDAAGDLLNDGLNGYSYDGEGRVATGAGVTYTYDGDGKRVKNSNGKLYWYGAGSDPLMETDLSGNLQYMYIFFGGQRIARQDSSGNRDYYFADHLGTARVVTNASGAVLDDSDFCPFGRQCNIVSSSSGNTYKFTGKERDSESGLDYFGARYDSSQYGRFMTPDPLGGQLANPQSLNRYAYVRNNPMSLVDPAGMNPDSPGAGDCEEVGFCDAIAEGDWGFGAGFNGVCGGDFGACGSSFGFGSIADQNGFNPESDVRCPNDERVGFGVADDGSMAIVQFYAFAGGTTGYFNPLDINQGVNEWTGKLYSDTGFQNYMRSTYATQLNSQYDRLSANLASLGYSGVHLKKDNAQYKDGHFNFAFTCTAGGPCIDRGRYQKGIHVPEPFTIHNDTVSPWISGIPFSFSNIFTTIYHGASDLFRGTVFNYVFPQ